MIHCPGCGAGLRFDIASQMMACDACGGSYDPALTNGSMNKEAKGTDYLETYVYLCPSCGGELLTTDRTDAVGFCPFCGGASMLYDRIHQLWQPEYIIPFQVTKEQCKENYVKAAKRSFFTSKKYRDPALIESFRGIYMPYWSYQTLQQGHFTLSGKKTGFFVNTFYRIDGETDVTLDGYAHDAARAFDDRISEDIAPYDPAGHKPFAPGYLSGFYADVGDVDAHVYHAEGAEAVRRSTAGVMGKDRAVEHGGGIGKIRVDEDTAQIPTRITASRRTLYPVWFMSYRNKDKLTYAAVNGQTGRVSADLPVSPWKILIAVLILGAVLAAGFFFLPSVKANLTLVFTSILLIVGALVLRHSFKNAVNPETGLDKTEEAVRFKKHDTIRLVIALISAVIGLIVARTDPAYNVISYGMCVALAAELFYMMIAHIRFQADIAKRRPPQFNKKGASSDEN